MRNQKLIGILTITILTLNLVLPLTVSSASPDPDLHSWYTVVPGVLGSDTYVLYPYELKSLNVGFSKYGELIGIPPGADMSVQANWVGLEYDGRDPFCSPSVIPMASWINGWFLDIQYIDPAFMVGSPKRDRHLWAFAMFGDGFSWGGDWVYATDPAAEPHGGRKTNGYCETEDLKVLYDGPRRFVALSVTHVYDFDGNVTNRWPVVDVILTLIFEKVKKEVILFKDIKLKIPKAHLWEKLNVQFSNREQYDLGPAPGYTSYADFFEQGGITCYGKEWHMADYLARDYYEYQTTTAIPTYTLHPPGPLVEGFLKIWVAGAFQDPSWYDVDWDLGTVTFKPEHVPPKDKPILFLYKYVFKECWHEYDIAQIISSDKKYVAWAAMWPPVSDYTVDGMLYYLTGPLVGVSENDMSTEPKQSPLVIGEWDFAMEHEELPQFRCVEVKGVTNLHDAVDDEWGEPTIDREVLFQLEEVFNPWDLVKAVHKDTKRWVEFLSGDGTWSSKTLKYKPVLDRSLPYVERRFGGWDEYCSFAERILLLPDYILLTPLDVLNELNGPDVKWWPSFPYTYTIKDGTITFWKDKDGLKTTFGDLIEWKPPSGKVIKVLYSTLPELCETHNSTKPLGPDEVTDDTTPPTPPIIKDEWTDNLGVKHDVELWLESKEITNNTAIRGNFTATLELGPIYLEGESKFKVYIDEIHKGWVKDLDTYTFTFTNWSITIDLGKFVKSIGFSNDSKVTWPLEKETIHVKYLGHKLYVTIQVTVTETPEGQVTIKPSWGWVLETKYCEELGGRYEWTIVGKDAYTVDSVGAALVTAAFKNKQVEIGMAGEDMYDAEIAARIPWVMRKFGTGYSRTDYYYLDGTKRTALKNDWCKTWPVSSSNMIGVGGPLANLLAYYGNDFTDAFYGMPEFSHPDWKGKVIALPCWGKDTYSSNENKGYAVIATYKDINGTVLFLIWGHWGRDTFYASKFFHEEIIYELQEKWGCGAKEVEGLSEDVEASNPPDGLHLGGWYKFDHVTAIILEIDYTDPDHPTFTIPEVLGTISERAVDWKGGIHDP